MPQNRSLLAALGSPNPTDKMVIDEAKFKHGMQQCITRLILDEPFYGALLQDVDYVTGREALHKCDTACVYVNNHMRIGLAFNPFFFESLTFDQQLMVLKHEVLHLLFKHLTRLKDFKIHSAANIAADMVVNQCISNIESMKPLLNPWLPKRMDFEDNQTSEVYYDKIVDEINEKGPESPKIQQGLHPDCKILTPQGNRNVTTLEPGDPVYVWNVNLGRMMIRYVIQHEVHDPSQHTVQSTYPFYLDAQTKVAGIYAKQGLWCPNLTDANGKVLQEISRTVPAEMYNQGNLPALRWNGTKIVPCTPIGFFLTGAASPQQTPVHALTINGFEQTLIVDGLLLSSIVFPEEKDKEPKEKNPTQGVSGDTTVQTPSGPVVISSLQAGKDKVYAYDFQNQVLVERLVLGRIDQEMDPAIYKVVDKGTLHITPTESIQEISSATPIFNPTTGDFPPAEAYTSPGMEMLYWNGTGIPTPISVIGYVPTAFQTKDKLYSLILDGFEQNCFAGNILIPTTPPGGEQRETEEMEGEEGEKREGEEGEKGEGGEGGEGEGGEEGGEEGKEGEKGKKQKKGGHTTGTYRTDTLKPPTKDVDLSKLPKEPKNERTLDDHEPMDGRDEEGREIIPSKIEEDLRRAIKRAVIAQRESKGGWGDLPAMLREEIERFLNPVINWKHVLRGFFGECIRIGKESTRKKPNRRFGYDFPGLRTTYGARIAIGVDTSGSVGKDEFERFAAEIDAIERQKIAEIIVIEIDAMVQYVSLWKKRRTTTFRGGGGTSFQPLWDAIIAKSHPNDPDKLLRKHFDGIIYFTDGDGPPPKSIARIRTLWAFTQKHHVGHQPFGKAIYVPPSDKK